MYEIAALHVRKCDESLNIFKIHCVLPGFIDVVQLKTFGLIDKTRLGEMS